MEIYQNAIKNNEVFACPHGLRCGKKSKATLDIKNKLRAIEIKKEDRKSFSDNEKIVL